MIDWSRIDELKDEVGKESFAEVIEVFFEEVGEVLDGLNPNDAEALKRDLHLLKGSALNIGLSAVSRLCAEAEAKLRDQPELQVNADSIRAAFVASKSLFEASTVA